MKRTTRPISTLTRRNFLRGTAAAVAAPCIVPGRVFGANDKINLAWVGLGAQGNGNLASCAHGNNVVALCDVDFSETHKVRVKKGHEAFVTGMGKKYPGAKVYQDFRKMLIEKGEKIDAVGISTHDSTHFAIAYMAMEMGKHVFVQKPLAHSIAEIRALRAKAAEKDVVTQMGNQGHASEGMRLIKEWYQAGLIGEVKEVIAWTNRPAGGFGFGRGKRSAVYPQVGPIPEGLDWDLWLGPVSKKIGYSKSLHPRNWRAWWDFGCGGLGDIGCHTIDAPFWTLELGSPTKVEVDVREVNPITTPNGSVVTYHFPARAGKPPVTLKWYEGPTMPPKPAIMGEVEMKRDGGMIMLGSKGAIYHAGMRPDSPRLLPDEKWQAYRKNVDQRVPKTLPRVGDIFSDWLNGIKTGTTPCSNFEYAVPLTEVIVLGTLAIRTGKTVEWDADAMKVTNDNPEAAALVNLPAREGWRVEDLTPAVADRYVRS